MDVERDGSLDDRLAARQPAQADEGALPGGDGPARRRQQVGEAQAPARLDQGVGELERPGGLELGGQPLAIIGGRRGQGRLGEIHRPASSGGRPIHARPLPHRREQVDEAGIDHEPLALDQLGVVGDRGLLGRSHRLDHPAPHDHGPRVVDLPRSGDDLRVLDREDRRIAVSWPHGRIVAAGRSESGPAGPEPPQNQHEERRESVRRTGRTRRRQAGFMGRLIVEFAPVRSLRKTRSGTRERRGEASRVARARVRPAMVRSFPRTLESTRGRTSARGQ